MNWREITGIVERAQTLDLAEQAAFLARVAKESPAAAPAAFRCLGIAELAATIDPQFMRTALIEGRSRTLAAALTPQTLLGPWRVLRCIDSGGMGSVYEAERADGLYQQRVALKLIHSIDDALAAAFERERQRLAQLDHPGIARIIDGGEAPDGRPFMVMEYVEGESIDLAMATAGASRQQIVRTVIEVCDAVAHAHGRLILHQDIKPANVLLDGRGKPRLIDFGIAADLSEKDGFAPWALTVAYAAPEQVFAERLSVRTDIFSLGVLLHQLLIGSIPEREPSGGVQVEASRIRDRDLTAILRRATALAPEDRYPAVDALSNDLLAWLEFRPVAARTGGVIYRSGRLLRRHPVACALAASAVTALIGGLAISIVLGNQAQQAAERARSALARAEWNAEQTDLQNRITTAYADALQRMSGAGMDVEQVTRLLLDYLGKQLSTRGQDPQSAALAAFAIGRHFLSRNDYVTARRVLEPWVTDGFGNTELVRMGWANLAYVYQQTGEAALAEAAFRRAAELASAYSREGPGYASTLAQIARYSGAETDRSAAVQALMQRAGADSSPWVRMTMYNQLFLLHTHFGDSDNAYSAIRAAVDIIDDNPSIELQGRDTNRLNLAETELFLRGDRAAAMEQVRRARATEEIAKGDSRESARALEIEGLIRHGEGELEHARNLLSEALDLHRRFGGAQSSYALRTAAALAMTLEDLGEQNPADAILQSGLSAADPSVPQILRVAEAYRTLRREGPEQAAALLHQARVSFDGAERNPHLHYHLRRLREGGLAIGDSARIGVFAVQ